MKKITALVLALMMACLMTCAFAAEADPLYTGEWYLKTMQNGDETIDVAAMGLNGVMTLNADWTCSMTGMGNDVTGTWKDEADKNKITVTMDGDDADVMLSDGELTVSAGETKMIFTREAPAAAGDATAEIKADATAEEFNGNWTCIALSVGSMKLDAATAKAAGQELPTLTYPSRRTSCRTARWPWNSPPAIPPRPCISKRLNNQSIYTKNADGIVKPSAFFLYMSTYKIFRC